MNTLASYRVISRRLWAFWNRVPFLPEWANQRLLEIGRIGLAQLAAQDAAPRAG